MDAREWLRRVQPLNFVTKRLKHSALLPFQNSKWLEYPVAQCVGKIRHPRLHELENIQCELAAVRSLLDDDEIIGLAQALPDFAELHGQQLPKERPDAHICEIVPFAAYLASA